MIASARLLGAALLCAALAACGGAPEVASRAPSASELYPGETPQKRAMIRRAAQEHGIPEALLHRVIQRESDYRAHARNGPYWGLMQILPQTARTMGFRGEPQELLDPEVNLRYAGRYLRGAWMVADGDIDAAVMWYARGYYYEARNRCMLVRTGLLDREVRRDCPARG
ncbi:MAG: lytic transglycosylase domain-containing protein [Rhodobacteraceae bacterium]|nr:lytic transglycosylase domain-containing protein [Paracoccaceae bacterium]